MGVYENVQQPDPGGIVSWRTNGEMVEHRPSEDSPELEAFIAHSEALVFKRCLFQGHAAAVTSEDDVRKVLQSLANTQPWNDANTSPFAFRLQGRDSNETDSEDILSVDDQTNGSEQAKEGWGDGGDAGAGEKLLYLLQRWDVQNVVVVVTRIDSGFMAAQLLGIRRYKVLLDRAKVVLEKCYLSSLTPGPDEETEEHETVNSMFPEMQSQDISDLVSRGPAPPPPQHLVSGDASTHSAGDNLSNVDLFPEPPEEVAMSSPRGSLPPGKVRTSIGAGGATEAKTALVARQDSGALSIQGNIKSSQSGREPLEDGIYRPSFATSVKITPRRDKTAAKQRRQSGSSLRSLGAFAKARPGPGRGRAPPKPPQAVPRASVSTVAVGMELPKGHVPDPLGGVRRKKRGQINNFKYDRQKREQQQMEKESNPHEDLMGHYTQQAARTWSSGNSATWFRAQVANARVENGQRSVNSAGMSMLHPQISAIQTQEPPPAAASPYLPSTRNNSEALAGPVQEEEVYQKLIGYSGGPSPFNMTGTGGISPFNATGNLSSHRDSMGFLRPWSEMLPATARSDQSDPLGVILGELGRDERPEIRIKPPVLTRQERNELKAMLHPVESLLAVLRGIRCLTHGANAIKAGWMECKRMACNREAIDALGKVNVSELPPDRLELARRQLASVPVAYEQLQRSNPAGAKFYLWLNQAVESFDKVRKTEGPLQEDLEMLANSAR